MYNLKQGEKFSNQSTKECVMHSLTERSTIKDVKSKAGEKIEDGMIGERQLEEIQQKDVCKVNVDSNKKMVEQKSAYEEGLDLV